MNASTPEQEMYKRGRRASAAYTDRRDLSYWDGVLGENPMYGVFLDGWTDYSSGDDEYRHLYFPEKNEAVVVTDAVLRAVVTESLLLRAVAQKVLDSYSMK